jgi:hypothetical protein
MDSLEMLKTLLQMTTEAEGLVSDFEKSEHLRILVFDMRRMAKKEHDPLRREKRQIETHYQLCMIGILEECNFGRVSWPNVMGLEVRLLRIRQDIDRTMNEIKASRRIM